MVITEKGFTFNIFAYQIEKKLSLVFLILCVLFSINYNITILNIIAEKAINVFFSFGVTSNFICNYLE